MEQPDYGTKNDKCMETVHISAVENKATGYMKKNPNEMSHAMETDRSPVCHDAACRHVEVKKKESAHLNYEEEKKNSLPASLHRIQPNNIKLKQTATMEQNQVTKMRGDGKNGWRKTRCKRRGFGRFTFSLSGENLSASLSQDAPLSVPNGAVRGCMRAFTWLSGDVALLPLKSQNHRDVRFYSDGSAHPARRVFHVAFGEQSRLYVGLLHRHICQSSEL